MASRSLSDLLYTSPYLDPSPSMVTKLGRFFSNGLGRPSPDSVMRAVYSIMGINTVVFGAWLYGNAKQDRGILHFLNENFLLSWHNINAGRYYTVITAAFSHAGVSHFAFNMFNFYVFGQILSFVPGIGAAHLLTLALGSAVAGSVGFLYQKRREARWRAGVSSSSLGASGMVMGIGATAACLMPFLPMNWMFIPVPIPLWMITGLYTALDVFYLNSGDLVGRSAHLGGSAFGVLYYLTFLRGYGGILPIMLRRLRHR